MPKCPTDYQLTKVILEKLFPGEASLIEIYRAGKLIEGINIRHPKRKEWPGFIRKKASNNEVAEDIMIACYTRGVRRILAPLRRRQGRLPDFPKDFDFKSYKIRAMADLESSTPIQQIFATHLGLFTEPGASNFVALAKEVPVEKRYIERTILPTSNPPILESTSVQEEANTSQDSIWVDVPTPVASDSSQELPIRTKITSYRILRDTPLSRKIKALHKYKCQICNHTIILPDGAFYAEAHHIKPLGEPHNGPDVAGNILCLCPNHHAEMDYLVSPIVLANIDTISSHSIDPQYVAYHNDLRTKNYPKQTESEPEGGADH